MKQKKINEKKILRKKQINIFTFDIETYSSKDNIHIPYLITLISDKEKKVWFKEKNNDIITEFKEHVQKHYMNYRGFAHNLGNFDGRLILDILKADEFLAPNKTCMFKDTSILAIYLKNDIVLVDSLHLLPHKLEKLAKQFKLDIVKGDLPHDKINELTYKEYKEAAISYCINDSEILYKVLKIFEGIIFYSNISDISPLNCITLPQFAFQTFRTSKYFPKHWELFKLDIKKYNFVADGYYGGKVDVFQTYAKSDNNNINYYDVNSLYPSAMLLPMPQGVGTWIEGENIDISNFFGFVEVTLEAPKSLHIPILPYRFDGALYFPQGVFTSVQFSEELKYALNYGYTIKQIKRGLSFEKASNIFDRYVLTLNKIKEKESKTRGPLYYIVKLLLNALYGKFGMKPIESEFRVIEPKDLRKYTKYCEVEHLVELKDAILIKVKDTPTLEATKTKDFFYNKEKEGPKLATWQKRERSPAHISAAIASYSRIVLDKCIRDIGEEHVCYVDTDGIISLKELSETQIDSSALGKWKLEGQFKEFYAFGPKIYNLIHNEPTKNIDRCAGIPNSEVEQALKSLRETYTYTSIQKLNFKKDRHTMRIQTNVNLKKTIKAYSTKKRKFYPDDIITYPLISPEDFNLEN